MNLIYALFTVWMFVGHCLITYEQKGYCVEVLDCDIIIWRMLKGFQNFRTLFSSVAD